MRARRGVLAAALLSLVAIAPAHAAEVADTGDGAATIDHAQPTDDGVELLVSVPAGSDLDLDGVEVTIGGEPVDASAGLASDSDLVRRTAVLALDTSLSMRGERIAAAQAAALTYLDVVPADVEVGLVTFDDDVTTVLAPTLDRDAARQALSELELQRETALYEGVVGALEATGPDDAQAGQRSVLLLSDGRDSTDAPLSGALRAVRDSGVLLDVVALQQEGAAALPLQLLAQEGRGDVLDASRPQALTAAFQGQAEELARQVVVSADVPEGAADSADVTVAVPSSSGPVEAAAYLPVRPGADPEVEAAQEQAAAEEARAAATAEVAAPAPGWQVADYLALGAVAAIGLGLLGMLLTLTLVRRGPDREDRLRSQLEAYGVFGAQQRASSSAQADSAGVADQFRGAAEKALAGHSGLEARIAARLEGAGSKLKPAEWVLLHGGIAIAATALGLLLGSGHVVLLLAGLAAGVVGPWVFLSIKRARRLSAFAAGLPDTLQLMAGSLSAGLSLAQSVDTIVREGAEPIAGEFRRAVVEGRLGVPFEDALAGVAERMESRDFEWVVMAIKIQREVGGNLAELLLQVTATLREREYLRRHVKALSAEGRLSAWVLGGLPPGFLLYLTASKPDYVQPLYSTPLGWLMLGGMAVLMAVGMFWMMKVAKVDL